MPPKNATPAPAAKAKVATKSTVTKTTAGKTAPPRRHGASAPKPTKTTAGKSTAATKTGASETTAVKKSPTPEVKVEAAAPAPAAAEPQAVTSATIGLKSFATYLMDEKDNDLWKSGRWPLISDETERSTTFLQYRNVNMLNVMNQNDMTPNRVRLALIGGLRYGKPVVFNMMTANVAAMYPQLVEYLDAVKPGLMKAIIDKEFLKEDYYMQLVKEEDGTEYKALNFNNTFMDNFMFIIASGTKDFPPEVIQTFFIVTVE